MKKTLTILQQKKQKRNKSICDEYNSLIESGNSLNKGGFAAVQILSKKHNLQSDRIYKILNGK
jgi:hypothetical protein